MSVLFVLKNELKHHNIHQQQQQQQSKLLSYTLWRALHLFIPYILSSIKSDNYHSNAFICLVSAF